MSIHQKAPLTRTLNAFAQQRALDEIQQTGKALPGHVIAVSGSLVTVNFDVTGGTFGQPTIPVFGPEYIRYPIKVGDKGYAMAADATLSQISGQGTATADITYQRGNLSNLVWMPIASKAWGAVINGFLVLYGNTGDGVVIQDVVGASPSTYLKITTGTIQLTAGGKTLSISSAGITLDGILWETHTHLPGTYNVSSDPVLGLSGVPS
jgi:hypothetical protein